MNIFGYKIEVDTDLLLLDFTLFLLPSFVFFYIAATGIGNPFVPVGFSAFLAFAGLALFVFFLLDFREIFTLYKVEPEDDGPEDGEPVHERKAISREAILRYSLIKAQKEHDYYTNLFYKEKAVLFSIDNVELVPILHKRLKDIAIKVDAKAEEIDRLKSELYAR